MLFNPPEYNVIEVTRDEGGGQRALSSIPVREAPCPGCGVLTGRVHQRTAQRSRDVPFSLVGWSRWWLKK